MATELTAYGFWFHSTANSLYEDMEHRKFWADPAWVRTVVTDYCVEHEAKLDSYGFLREADGGFTCPELDDDSDWQELEEGFCDGALGFYFRFDENSLATGEDREYFISELSKTLMREATTRTQL